MDRERRKEAIKVKIQRLDDSIARTRKDREGKFSTLEKYLINTQHSWLEAETFCITVNVLIQGYVFFFYITFNIFIPGVAKLMKTYSGNPSFSNQKNLEETEQQLDEVKLMCSRSIWVHLTLIAALFNNVVLLLVVFS